ncbi:hypothetical protein SK3146_05657 [Paenibacillus konkukensis]|uniref:Copper amine oxidase-like N-terminal domain-containing protein n=1 Tax=Paenibacillus konkukensis TaxID=2020716 RepID=A0ABY4RUR7_9BACL|nr:hypothetical protein [Paenibacillus konkukensis]UQZ86364.1 hypothetical protein SK3146_05657 [Paenibacillus konkukensis]
MKTNREPRRLWRRWLAAGTAWTFAYTFAAAAPAAAELPASGKIGDVIGRVLSTDIRASINGQPIPSMNIDGYTAVVAEDLRQYGFEVAWLPAQHKVSIHYASGKPAEPPPAQQDDPPSRVGVKLGDVLYTDIQAEYDGVSIPSYNIGGQTAVRLNDLGPFGQVEWNEQARTLSFAPGETEAYKEHAPLVIRQTAITELGPITAADSVVRLKDAVIGRIADGTPMLSIRKLAERLGYLVSEDARQHTLTLDNGVNRIQMTPDRKGPSLYWLGSETEGPDWSKAPLIENGDWLVHEQDARALLGCSTDIDHSDSQWDYRCAEYEVQDYGVLDSSPSYLYGVQADAYLDDGKLFIPALIARNHASQSLYTEGRFNVFKTGEAAGDGGLSRYKLAAETPLDIKDNDVVLQITNGYKVLYQKRFAPATELLGASGLLPDDTPLPHGEYSRISLDQPASALTATELASVQVSGSVRTAVGSKLKFIVEKREEAGYREVWEQSASLPAERFSEELPLPSGQGLYRVRIQSEQQEAAGVIRSDFDIARLYVRKTAGDPIPSPVDAQAYTPPASAKLHELSGSWTAGSYPERFVGYRGMPLALSLDAYDFNSPNGFWLGSPVEVDLQLTHVGDNSLEMTKPIVYDVIITRVTEQAGESVFQPVWHGRAPALTGSLKPLYYRRFQFSWDMKDDDGHPVPPGNYHIEAVLPMTYEYNDLSTGQAQTQLAEQTMRTHALLTAEWPQP